MFNNKLTGSGRGAGIQMTEYDGWAYHFLSTYPGYDPIKDSYIWNNTFNGTEIGVSLYSGAADAVFIQEDRDYWLVPAPGYKTLQYPHPLVEESMNPTPPPALRVESD